MDISIVVHVVVVVVLRVVGFGVGGELGGFVGFDDVGLFVVVVVVVGGGGGDIVGMDCDEDDDTKPPVIVNDLVSLGPIHSPPLTKISPPPAPPPEGSCRIYLPSPQLQHIPSSYASKITKV
jgi:hypothetical protein